MYHHDARLQAVLREGARTGLQVIEHVNTNAPNDRLVRGRALRWGYAAPAELALAQAKPEAKPLGDPALAGLVNDEGIPLQVAAILDEPARKPRALVAAPPADAAIPELVLEIADGTHRLHRNAFSQVAGRAGVPGDYLRRLTDSQNPAMRQLALDILAAHYGKTEQAAERHLVRDVHGEVRGFLSDKYRRLDSRPLLDAFLTAAREVGAVPGGGLAGQLRTSFKVFLPTLFEPVPDDPIVIGLEWHNSDFGAGAFSISLTLLRMWCTNGATIEETLRKTHVGSRLSDDVAWSKATMQADSATMALATGDIVRNHLAADKVEGLVAAVKAAHEKCFADKQDPFGSNRRFAALTKGELAKVRDAFDSNDVVNLPPGRTLWRASNAVSWVAQHCEDEERKHALERLAGDVLKAA